MYNEFCKGTFKSYWNRDSNITILRHRPTSRPAVLALVRLFPDAESLPQAAAPVQEVLSRVQRLIRNVLTLAQILISLIFPPSFKFRPACRFNYQNQTA